jgi:hypothetical protein
VSPRAIKVRPCTYHCRPCDGHFTSLRAFDAHHERQDDGRVWCQPPERVEALRAVAGVCRISVAPGGRYGDARPVMIYEHAATAEHAREVFAARR